MHDPDIPSKVAAGGGAAGVWLLIPSDWPLLLAILLGLVVGTLASWVWNDQSGLKLPKRWLLWQVGSWGLIFVLILAAQESMGLSTRASMAAAATFAWLGRDGLHRLRKYSLERIGADDDTTPQVPLPGTDSAGPSSSDGRPS